jgi:hypothetical protein
MVLMHGIWLSATIISREEKYISLTELIPRTDIME